MVFQASCAGDTADRQNRKSNQFLYTCIPMRLKISLLSDKAVTLPKEFNSITQALIYQLIDKLPAQWLHNGGFKFEKRSFKLFTFSSILEKGTYQTSNHYLSFLMLSAFISHLRFPGFLHRLQRILLSVRGYCWDRTE